MQQDSRRQIDEAKLTKADQRRLARKRREVEWQSFNETRPDEKWVQAAAAHRRARCKLGLRGRLTCKLAACGKAWHGHGPLARGACCAATSHLCMCYRHVQRKGGLEQGMRTCTHQGHRQRMRAQCVRAHTCTACLRAGHAAMAPLGPCVLG